MREKLFKLTTCTRKFTATIGKTGSVLRHKNRKCVKIKTLCLEDVSLNNDILSDNCWIAKPEELKDVKRGFKISFVATIEPYYKNVNGEKVKDYCLTNIKNIEIIKDGVN